MVTVRQSSTTVELDTSFLRNLDAGPGVILEFEVIRYSSTPLSLARPLLGCWPFLARYAARFADFDTHQSVATHAVHTSQ